MAAEGSPHDLVRLHTSVWEKSPPLRQGSTDSSKQRLQGFYSTARAFLPSTERSDRGNTAIGHRTRVLQPLRPRSKVGRRPEAHSGPTAFEFFPLQREVQDADDENHHVSDPRRGLVCHYRPKGCVFSHPGRSETQEVPSVCLWREGLPIQGPALRPGLGAENIHEMHGCCTGPFEAPGHLCTELSGRLAHSGSLQGASKSSQGYRSPPYPFSWPQDERMSSGNRVSGGSFGFRSDAGPFGFCPDTRFYSMSGPLQARLSCLCRYLPQDVRPHGSGLPCVSPRVASHEAVPLVDEGAEVTPHCTSHSPYQGVAQLLSTPFTMARPHFSPERGENGCDPPSSPLVPVQVPFFEGSSRSGNTEPCGRFSVETEAQAGGMDVEPSDGIPDLGSVWQSGGGPLCFSRVIPVPALVLPEFPDDSGHRCVRPSVAECQSVRISANKADSGSTMQSEGEQCPPPSHSTILALPDLVLGANSPLVSVSLGDSDQAGLAVPASGQDLASSTRALEVVGMANTGPRAVMNVLPVEVQETIASARAPLLGSCTLLSGASLNPGVWVVQLTQ